jgi:hypothetical protein
MTTLHVDITIKDLATFRNSFGEHAGLREQAGVVAERVSHLAGDESRLQIELDFPSAEKATTFLDFLRESVWKGNPAIDGTPEARVLEPVALEPV